MVAQPASLWTVIGQVASVVGQIASILSAGAVAVFTWCLVRVSRRQGAILNATLIETRKAADAATQNARAAMEGQRAHITGSPLELLDFAVGMLPKLGMVLKNVGTTPAYKCSVETWVELLPTPFVDFSKNAVVECRDNNFVLYQNSPMPKQILRQWNRALTEQEVSEIQADRFAIYFRLRLKYVDAFGGEQTQNFAFSAKSGGGFESLPKYNDD